MTISKQQTALVHVAKKELGLSDADYRAVLDRIAGVTSSRALDEAGFERVMAEFEALGFRHVKHPAPATRREGMASPGQISRLRALWKRYRGADDYDEPGLERWLEVHLSTSALRFLDVHRAGKGIAIIEKMIARKSGKRADDEGAAARTPT